MTLARYAIPLALLISIAAGNAHGQCALPGTASGPRADGSARRVIGAVRASAPPELDGRLDDAVWQRAPVATGFVQQRPNPGAPATQRTEARVLYDDEAIYIAMRMEKTVPGPLAAAVARRDYTGFSDWAQIMIDSHHDRRTAFRFGVNPAGVQKDALEYDDGNGEDVSWDAVWQAATRIDSAGWTAEFRIPLSQLRFSGNAGRADSAGTASQVWGIEFLRDVARLNERDYWAFIPPAGPGFVSCFGDLDGLRGLTPPRRLEMLPYTLASVTREPGTTANPFFERNDARASVGADFKYGLTSDLTLTGTVNPDFGQVEADPSVVNLSAFETFFPEKRPFFVEGSDLFQFDIGFPIGNRDFSFGNDQPFYTRRVGRAPQGGLPDSAVFADMPEAATILGAAKLSGKTAHGWSVGIMDALTQREMARYTGPGGARLDAPVEPLTNYTVARLKKDLRQGESAIGGIVTATHRNIGDDRLDFLTTDAYTAGLDGHHRFGGGNYQFTGSVLGTAVRGSSNAIALVQQSPGHYFQRPDASYLTYDPSRTSLSGAAASARLARIGGGHWRWTLAGHVRSPGFDMNDAGFEQSTDWIVQGALLQYLDFQPGRHVRDWNALVGEFSGWSFGGERRTTGAFLNAGLNLLNNWGAFLSVSQQFPALSIDALRGGPALRTPGRTSVSASIYSDARKPVSAELDGALGRESESGGRDASISTSVSVRPSGAMELSLGPSVSWNRNPWQYVTQRSALGTTHYVFGRIDQTTAALTLRARYSFTPNFSFQFYGEPFISAGAYEELKEVADPRAAHFADRFHTFTTSELSYDDGTRAYRIDLDGDDTPDLQLGNPDFNIKQFRSTAVMRWEYRPGSALFVVWSQGRSLFTPTGEFELGHDTRDLFGADATNILLVKLNFWLDM
jgi:hypothetical protein